MRVIDIFIAGLVGLTAIGLLRMVLLLSRHRYTQKQPVKQGISVSVCIAARNERHALAQCLENVLASDYEKLEVLVLDDSSGDDTSYIIKSFAQGGVRFLAGKSLPSDWLGKNHALKTLSEEASGDVLLFIDVDTLISPTTISQLVAAWQENSLKALSVLPRREDSQRASALLGTFRYFWELLLSTSKHPTASSALMMIERNTFADLIKNHASLSKDVRLEVALATLIAPSYRYFVGSAELGVRYEKRWLSQIETSGRIYYPIVGRRVVNVVIASLLIAGVIFIGVVPGWVVGGPFARIGDVSFIVFCLMFGYYNALTMGGGWFNIILRSLLWPLLLVQELTLLIGSFVRYISGNVTWKGRRLTEQPIKHDYQRLDE